MGGPKKIIAAKTGMGGAWPLEMWGGGAHRLAIRTIRDGGNQHQGRGGGLTLETKLGKEIGETYWGGGGGKTHSGTHGQVSGAACPAKPASLRTLSWE